MDAARLRARDRLVVATPWLPVLVAVPALLLLPGLVAVAVVFAAWALTLAVLAVLADRDRVTLGTAAAVAALVSAGVLVLVQ